MPSLLLLVAWRICLALALFLIISQPHPYSIPSFLGMRLCDPVARPVCWGLRGIWKLVLRAILLLLLAGALQILLCLVQESIRLVVAG